MEQDWLQTSELLDSGPRKGLTLDFRAPLAISEEAVELYFGDITNSSVECQKRGCILRVTFSDSEAFQRAVNVSSYTIENGCVLTPLSTSTTALPPVANVANPTNSGSRSPTKPQSGVDGTTGVATVVLSLNVDCQEHITKYCLEDLNRYLNVSWCIIRSAEVSGLLLLEYSTSTSQLDVSHIVNKIYEYTQQFTTTVVAVPGHHDERNLNCLMQPCSASVSYCLIDCLSEKKLYKFCCKKNYAPKLQQHLSGITTVQFASCSSSADICGKADPKRREEDPHGDAVCIVKSEQSASDAVTKNATALPPSNVLASSVSELNRDATPSVTTSGTNATSAAAAATTQIASHTGDVVSESVPFIGAPGSSTSVDLAVAVQQVPRKILEAAPTSSASASAAGLSTPRDYQTEVALSELEASAGSKIQKTPAPVESAQCVTSHSDRLNIAADDVLLTVPADDDAVQFFKKNLEYRFRKDLDKLFPATEPTCSVKYNYSDRGFHFFGNRDSVLKAKVLLFSILESAYYNERQLEMNRLDEFTSSRRMGKADNDTLHHKSKLNDGPTAERTAADRGRYDFGATPESDAQKRQTRNEWYKDELPGKIGEEASLPSAATLQQDAFDKHSRRDKLAASAGRGFTAERAFTSDCLLLQLVMGSVADQEADVLVNSVDSALNLSYGSIARSMVEKGGQGLQLELKNKYPQGLKEFQYAVTRGYGLHCRNVLHVVCGPYTARESEQKFRSLIFECLKYANESGMNSIVFPAIGAGVLKYPPGIVVEVLHSAVSMFSDAFPERSLVSVKCAVYDKPTYDSFKYALDALLRGVGAGSRFLTPMSFETPAYDSTYKSYSQVASTRTTSLPQTHLSASSGSASDWMYKKK